MMVEHQGPGTQAMRENQTELAVVVNLLGVWLLHVTPRTLSVSWTRKTASTVTVFGRWLTVPSLKVVFSPKDKGFLGEGQSSTQLVGLGSHIHQCVVHGFIWSVHCVNGP
jgi:hypothetical protein